MEMMILVSVVLIAYSYCALPVLLAFPILMVLMATPLWGSLFESSTIGLLDSTMSSALLMLLYFTAAMMLLSTKPTCSQSNMLSFAIMSLTLILTFTFKVDNIMLFYFMFEASLIPIFIMVLSWGYQPERLSASLNLILYTIFSSLPLLMSIISIVVLVESSTFTRMQACSLSLNFSGAPLMVLSVFLVMSFLVKFPMFSLHLWLPKAHVEAPVSGSMVLAAVLLKLGGYGIIRLSPILMMELLSGSTLSLFALWGGGVVAFTCVRQFDLKILIAYSSVAHMGMVIGALLSQTMWGLMGGFFMMIAHGVASSGLFSGANILYERSSTRNMLLTKSTLNSLPVFSLWWFLLCMCNMGAPPTINLFSEVISVVSLVNFNFLLLIPLMMMTMLAVVFSLMLYSSTQQGQLAFSLVKVSPLSSREVAMLFSHSFMGVSLGLAAIMVYYISIN